MHDKEYLLLTIFLVVGILSTTGDQSQAKDESKVALKKQVFFQDREPNKDKPKETNDALNNNYLALAYAYGRYSPMNSPEFDYRPRLTWPQFKDSLSAGSSNSKTTTTVPGIGATCNALIDPQYPLFSDMCGAVPQARYALPNSFGHYDRWQINHVLTSLMGSSTDPVCIRSLRYLLCPMLFQPCRVRHEPRLVLPCQHFCRAVKAHCGASTLDIIPCDSLPLSSDYCPSIQIQNYFSPSGIPSPTAQQSQPTTPPTPPTPPSNPQTPSKLPGFPGPIPPSTPVAAPSMSPTTIGDREIPNEYRQVVKYPTMVPPIKPNPATK